MPETKKTIVLYDDRCRTCSVARSTADMLDSRNTLEFVGMHTDPGKSLIEKHGLDMEKSAYAIDPDGNVRARSDMVKYVLYSMGFLGRLLAHLFSLLPNKAADRIYEFAAKHRIR